MTYARLKKVLVVDDEDDIRAVLKISLGMLGLSVLEARDGDVACDILATQRVDLLVTDFRMPNMSGPELLAWCREHEIEIPVIFVSGNADLMPAEQVALGDCCATLMFKPVNMDVLRAAIGAADSRNHHRDCVHVRSEPV